MIFTRFNDVDIMFNNLKTEINIHINTEFSIIISTISEILKQRNIEDILFKKATAKDFKYSL